MDGRRAGSPTHPAGRRMLHSELGRRWRNVSGSYSAFNPSHGGLAESGSYIRGSPAGSHLTSGLSMRKSSKKTSAGSSALGFQACRALQSSLAVLLLCEESPASRCHGVDGTGRRWARARCLPRLGRLGTRPPQKKRLTWFSSARRRILLSDKVCFLMSPPRNADWPWRCPSGTLRASSLRGGPSHNSSAIVWSGLYLPDPLSEPLKAPCTAAWPLGGREGLPAGPTSAGDLVLAAGRDSALGARPAVFASDGVRDRERFTFMLLSVQFLVQPSRCW